MAATPPAASPGSRGFFGNLHRCWRYCRAKIRRCWTRLLAKLDQHWAYVYDIWRANWPCRTTAIAVISVTIALFTDAGQDLLQSLVTEERLSGDFVSFVVGTLIFVFGAWYWTMRTLAYPYKNEDVVLLDYRTRYPPRGFAPKSAEARNSAENRVAWIKYYRSHLPVVWGGAALASVCVATFWTARYLENTDQVLIVSLIQLAAILIYPVIAIFHLNAYGKKLVALIQTHKKQHAWVRQTITAILSIPFVFYMLLTFFPVSVGQCINPVFAFLAIIGVFIALGSWVAMHQRTVAVPLLSVFAIAVLTVYFVFSLLPASKSAHPVRLLSTEDGGGQPFVWNRPTVEFAAEQWWKARQQRRTDTAPEPFIIVATAGGGSRAAYWTMTVLGQLNGKSKAFSDHLFAISGVSGGSVGATFYRALLTIEDERAANGTSIAFPGTGQEVLKTNFLGPVLAALFGADLANGIVPILDLPDRAEAIERAWEIAFETHTSVDISERSFSSLWPATEQRPWPALLLNGTVVETGERIVTSNLILDDNVSSCSLFIDAVKFSGSDFRVSTAANNSARFPYIEPAGALKNVDPDDRCFDRIRIVDGGYFENFGATTARDVMLMALSRLDDLQANIEPIVILISSDPAISDQFGVPNADGLTPPPDIYDWFPEQQSAPVRALYNTRTSHGEESVHQLRELIKNRGRFFHFELCAYENNIQPPLSWSLSEEAWKSIEASMNCGKNQDALTEIRSLLKNLE